MKILYILPGSGGSFYCENCIRDVALVKALRMKGHDVVMVPLSLPLFTDDPYITKGTPLFFGGINAYLQQTVPLFRRTPRWVDRLFDAPWLISVAAKFARTTRAKGLGNMTISMLRGQQGHQHKEVERLLTWLDHESTPDVIHVTNLLLLGLVRPLKQRLQAPVVCTTMDEDVWLDAMRHDHREACWDILREESRQVDAFVTVSRHYAYIMQNRLALQNGAISVIPIGIDAGGYSTTRTATAPTLGYLARTCEGLGLGTLIDAFIDLKRDELLLRDLRLRVMGGYTGDDRKFIRQQKEKLSEQGMLEDVEFIAELDRESRMRFLESLSVLSVPIPEGEAFGTFIIESLAAGVPVVQPRVGGFTEVVEETGGGILYDPDDPDALRSALFDLLTDEERAHALGSRGRGCVVRDFTITRMVEETIKLYERVAADAQ